MMRFPFKNKLGRYPTKKFVTITDDSDVGGYYTAPRKWCSFTKGVIRIPPVSTDSKRKNLASQAPPPKDSWKEYKIHTLYEEFGKIF